MRKIIFTESQLKQVIDTVVNESVEKKLKEEKIKVKKNTTKKK